MKFTVSANTSFVSKTLFKGNASSVSETSSMVIFPLDVPHSVDDQKISSSDTSSTYNIKSLFSLCGKAETTTSTTSSVLSDVLGNIFNNETTSEMSDLCKYLVYI